MAEEVLALVVVGDGLVVRVIGLPEAVKKVQEAFPKVIVPPPICHHRSRITEDEIE